MKKGIFIFCVFVIFLMSPYRVNAKECSPSFKQNISKIANSIKIDYQYIDDINSNNKFKFIVSEIPKNITIEDNIRPGVYKNDSNSNTTIKESDIVEGGISNTFTFYYTGNECDVYSIKKQTIKLPFYNEYWDKEICKGLENYTYCKKFVSVKIKYNTLEKRVNEIKEKNKDKNISKISNNKNNKNFNLINIIVIISIILIIISIIIINKNNKRRRIKI